jgi:hypothetical protein
MTLEEFMRETSGHTVHHVGPAPKGKTTVLTTPAPGSAWLTYTIDAQPNTVRQQLGMPPVNTVWPTIKTLLGINWITRQHAAWRGRRLYQKHLQARRMFKL